MDEGGGAGGIAEVMEAVEEGDEVVVLAGVVLCRGDGEVNAVGEALTLGGGGASSIGSGW